MNGLHPIVRFLLMVKNQFLKSPETVWLPRIAYLDKMPNASFDFRQLAKWKDIRVLEERGDFILLQLSRPWVVAGGELLAPESLYNLPVKGELVLRTRDMGYFVWYDGGKWFYSQILKDVGSHR